MSTRAATPAGLRKKGRSSAEDDAGVSCVNARAEGASFASLAAVAAASGLAGMAFASPAAAGGAEKVRPINRARAITRALAHGFELRLMCFLPRAETAPTSSNLRGRCVHCVGRQQPSCHAPPDATY